MKIRPLTSLSKLTQEQVNLLSDLLQTHTYAHVQATLLNWGHKISIGTLQRFYQRDSQAREMDARPALSASAKAYLQFVIQGAATLNQASLKIIEQKAFEYCHAFRPSELPIIQTLFAITLQSRDMAVRERLAKVQEQRFALKAEDARTFMSAKPATPTQVAPSFPSLPCFPSPSAPQLVTQPTPLFTSKNPRIIASYPYAVEKNRVGTTSYASPLLACA